MERPEISPGGPVTRAQLPALDPAAATAPAVDPAVATASAVDMNAPGRPVRLARTPRPVGCPKAWPVAKDRDSRPSAGPKTETAGLFTG